MKAAFALLLLAAPAADGAIGPRPYRLLTSVAEAQRTTGAVTPGAVVTSAILGRPDAALLTAPLSLAKLGEKRSWAQGVTLGAMSVTGVPGTPKDIYCEDEREGSIGKILTGQMLFGIVGALRRTKLDTRFCLFDQDEDGKLDHAFLLGAKGASNRAPYAIPPAPFAVISGLALGGNSHVRLRYAGPSGDDGRLRFDLELEGYGRFRRIGEQDLTISQNALPQRIEAANAVIVVERYDPATYAAEVRIERPMAPGRILIADAPVGE